jgi:hypothetical protein
MRALSPPEVLKLWEAGRTLHPLDQGVLAIRAILPNASDDSVADWPLGRRNRVIGALRRACFGSELRGRAMCPRCAEPVEFALDADALTQRPQAEVETVTVSAATFRLPSSRILASVIDEPDAETAAARLCDLCRIGGEKGLGDEPPLSPSEIDRIGEAMALADPLAEIAFGFECPSCGAAFRENLDIAEFFWKEIEVEARRLLIEVHTLASAYGWREQEVLALSSARRAFYVERVLG